MKKIINKLKYSLFLCSIFLLFSIKIYCFESKNYNNINLEIYYNAKDYISKGKYNDAILLYNEFLKVCDSNKYNEEILFDKAYCYFKKNDFKNSLLNLEKYIFYYRYGKYIDHAYYLLGIINFNLNDSVFNDYLNKKLYKQNFDLTNIEKSKFFFEKVVNEHKNSIYYADSLSHLIIIKKIFETHELDVIKFYFNNNLVDSAKYRLNELIGNSNDPEIIKLAKEILNEHLSLENKK